MSEPRTRRSFRELENEHYQKVKDHQGSKGRSFPFELETLVLAFSKIQDPNYEDFNSFFTIAGYHGEPFRGAGWGSGNAGWWGGNILFPTWHRAYLWRLETALRGTGADGAGNIALPFWDECDEETRESGIPLTLGLKDFPKVDGIFIPNPFHSYTFETTVWDNVGSDQPDSDYTKHAGYTTVRYPQSGLGMEAAKLHNEEYSDPKKNWEYLNENVKEWLGPGLSIDHKWRWTRTKFDVDRWKPDPTHDPKASKAIVPLKTPHNSIHLAIGGFDIVGQGNAAKILGANGDMGEDDTAAFDPIFYFHHCFIDYTFWKWQQKHEQTEKLITEPGFEHFPGTNSTDSQGATPGVPGNSWLSVDTTALEPFTQNIGDSRGGPVLTSQDVADIGKLGYTYGRGSLDPKKHAFKANPIPETAPVLRVTGASRSLSRGSFLVTVWADLNGDSNKDELVGLEPVLSRQHVSGCANCQTHLGVKTFINLHAMADMEAADINDRTEVRVQTREDLSGTANDNQQWKRTMGRVGTIS